MENPYRYKKFQWRITARPRISTGRAEKGLATASKLVAGWASEQQAGIARGQAFVLSLARGQAGAKDPAAGSSAEAELAELVAPLPPTLQVPTVAAAAVEAEAAEDVPSAEDEAAGATSAEEAEEDARRAEARWPGALNSFWHCAPVCFILDSPHKVYRAASLQRPRPGLCLTILPSLILWRVCMEGCMRAYIIRYFPLTPGAPAAAGDLRAAGGAERPDPGGEDKTRTAHSGARIVSGTGYGVDQLDQPRAGLPSSV
jgi:hypothetical protein